MPVESKPLIIQGGMGVGVSNWRLAKAVGMCGQMGVVSGTALDSVFIRRLQLGDPDGAMRHALAQFPWPAMAERILKAYWIPGGKAPEAPFHPTPMATIPLRKDHIELLIVANFCEVYLAKEGHTSPIGINYLEKVQLPTLPSLFGALLADVDYVIMGGGIPLAIPGILDALAKGEPAEHRLDVIGAEGEPYVQRLNPAEIAEGPLPILKRPQFLAIVSSDTIAKAILRRASGKIDGLVVENHTAGGHNAPPRRKKDEQSQPSFGLRDVPDIAAIRALGKPFWLAGGYTSPEGLQAARALGACGIQVGTAFAWAYESGLAPHLKAALRRRARSGELEVITDFKASPTGYPFKIALLPEAPGGYGPPDIRQRVCDLGYLRTPYVQADGHLGYRCPAEPVNAYIAKGGAPEDTVGRRCLCNGLLAAIGLGQVRPWGTEPPIITSGKETGFIMHLPEGEYTAQDVLAYLLR